jgi:hypothetical protein
MVHKLLLSNISPVRAIELKNELVAAGLVQNQDFIWAYYQAKYNEFSVAGVDPSTVIFDFCDQKLATFYQLKWFNLQ